MSTARWRLALVPLLLGAMVLLGGCGGPTCQSACEKAFTTCGMTWVNQDQTAQEQINSCVAACNQEMNAELKEQEAVGWVSCVDAYTCASSDSGLSLCLDCSAGYYQGRTDGTTCTTSASSDVSTEPQPLERLWLDRMAH